MNSRIIGSIVFNEECLQEDIRKILRFNFNQTYAEYSIGEWKNCVLWNGSGAQLDANFRGYEGAIQKTELGAQLDYINSMISETFHTEHLRWVRVFSVRKGMIMPHRDYLDLPEGEYLRIHIPIQTDQSCLHSECNQVYHMRKGELWFLDATQPHAACSLSEIQRLTITLDFDRSIPFESLFKDPKSYVEYGNPCYIGREAPDNKFLEGIANLGHIINEFNFAQIVAILAQAHFFKAVDCAQMYDWLIDVTNQSKNVTLVEKAVQMKQYYLGI